MQPSIKSRNVIVVRNPSAFLSSTIFMFALINGFFAELFSVFGKNYPTALGLAAVALMSFMAWLMCFSIRPRMTIGILFIATIIIVVSQVLTPGVFGIFFDFGNGGLRDIGISHFFQLFVLVLPSFLLCLCGVSVKELYRYMRLYSVITTIMFIVLMLLNIMGRAEKLNYMTVAYNALPGICVLFYDAFEYKKKSVHVLWIVASICILLGGCRGALLTLVATFIVWWMCSLKPFTASKLLGLLAATLVVVVIITNITPIAIWMDKVLQKFGYSSRIVSKFLGTSADGELFVYSDRAKLNASVISNLDIVGHGVYSDQILLDGTYVHNFVLEILYQYGYLLGIPILGGILLFIRRSFVAACCNNDRLLLFGWVLFVTTLCVKLMFSSTYLTDRQVWFFAGLAALSLQNGSLRTQ